MTENPSLQHAIEAYQSSIAAGGIGTLGEKSLHGILKFYCAPDKSYHEQKAGRYIADILQGNQITEIQTGSFYPLRCKLAALLPVYEITVVYPVPALKWISWIDPVSGEAAPKRKSPKKAGGAEILRELFYIRDQLRHPHLHFRILLLEMLEYRLQNGWGNGGKRGSERYERCPLSVLGEIRLQSADDLRLLLPQTLQAPFTSKQFSKQAKLSPRATSCGLQVLVQLGILERCGKRGKAFLYRPLSQYMRKP